MSDREGWISMAGPAATQCTFQGINIWHTTDAGAHWEVAAAEGLADAFGCKRGLYFADSRRGFLGAWDLSGPPTIYRTTDGGRTWSGSKPLPDPPGFTTLGAGVTLRPGRVRAFVSTFLVEAQGVKDGRMYRHVFRSADEGASWTFVSTCPEPGGALAFVSASRWLQLIEPGLSQETIDGGKSWHLATSDYQQSAPIAPDVVFADARVGYATVRGLISRTLDGGAHWTAIRTPGTG